MGARNLHETVSVLLPLALEQEELAVSRRILAAALCTALLLTGCAASPEPAPATPNETPNETLKETVKGPESFTAPEFASWLQAQLNAGADLAGLFETWWGGMKPDRIPRIGEADLNRDGNQERIVAVGGVKTEPERNPWVILVIAGKPGAYQVDYLVPDLAPTKTGFMYVSKPVATQDLNGDGRTDFVWSLFTVVGASGGRGYVVTGAWEPGRISQWGKAIHMPNMTDATLDGQELIVKGGVSGGVSASVMQRPRTDRHRLRDSGWRLAGREFAPSPLTYHRLIDGIVYESLGRPADALKAYRDATAPGAQAIKEPRQLKQPERLDQFTGAVQALAQVRLGALLLRQGDNAGAQVALGAISGALSKAVAGATTADDLCRRAETWAGNNPDFTAALNQLSGFGNPEWSPQTLCGPVTLPDLE